MRRPAHRLATAVAVNLVLALPLLLIQNPLAFRLGAAYVLAVLVAAALGGSWTATVAGALSLISFWHSIAPAGPLLPTPNISAASWPLSA